MNKEKSPFASIEETIEDIRQGRMIIIVDDEDRENEGDLTVAAERVTPEQINFMAKFGRGLICLTLTSERCDQLNLRPVMQFLFPGGSTTTRFDRIALWATVLPHRKQSLGTLFWQQIHP